MKKPTVSRKTYFITWGGLLALTVLTTLLGFIDLGTFTMVLAVAIAAAKASLIAAFFMHALYENKIIRVVMAGGVVWFLIMITLTLNDYLTRNWLPIPK